MRRVSIRPAGFPPSPETTPSEMQTVKVQEENQKQIAGTNWDALNMCRTVTIHQCTLGGCPDPSMAPIRDGVLGLDLSRVRCFQTLLGSRSSFDLSSSDQVGLCVWRHLVTSRAPSSQGRQVHHHTGSKSTRESIIFPVALSTRKTPKPRVVKHSKTTLVSNFSWMRNPHSQEVTVSTFPHLKAGFHSADSSPATPRMLDVASVRRGSSGGKTFSLEPPAKYSEPITSASSVLDQTETGSTHDGKFLHNTIGAWT